MTMPEISSNVLPAPQAVRGAPARHPDQGCGGHGPGELHRRPAPGDKEAGRLAGLDVMRLINEPTAAALAYGFGRDRQQIICVFRFRRRHVRRLDLRLNGEVFEVLRVPRRLLPRRRRSRPRLGEVLAAGVQPGCCASGSTAARAADE